VTTRDVDGIANFVSSNPSGSRIMVEVNPSQNVQCALLFRALGKGLAIQWVTGTFEKSTSHTSFFTIDGDCTRLPITRVYRRFSRHGHFKSAVYSHVLRIAAASKETR
jgi:hypothetical protein